MQESAVEMPDKRVAGREDVEAVVREVLAAWLAGKGEPNVTCVYDINSGPCAEFADEVVEAVLERFPDTKIEVEDYADYLAAEGLTAQGIHYYVKMDCWYFDASVPEGTVTPDCLPTCRSIRICAEPIDGDEAFEDGEEFAEDEAGFEDPSRPRVF